MCEGAEKGGCGATHCRTGSEEVRVYLEQFGHRGCHEQVLRRKFVLLHAELASSYFLALEGLYFLHEARTGDLAHFAGRTPSTVPAS